MKRRGRKSEAQTPAPPSERIVGSSKNPKGSASSKSSASKIQISKQVEEVLKKKAKDYNESHQSKVTLATLKAVFRRGAGAYSSSHRPTIGGGKPNSRTAWAYARVNKFLLKKGGTKVKEAYVQDDDLMADGGEIRLLAPNGKQSNLTPEQYKLVRTPQFKAWFGDWENDPENASKVIDENGEPLVCYHATDKGNIINKFYKRSAGIHFGTKKAAKDRREQTDFGNIGYDLLEVFLKIKNPFIANRDFNWEWEEMEYVDDFDITQDDEYKLFETYAHKLGYNIFTNEGLLSLEELLYKYDFDGIFYKNQKEDKGSTSYLVIEPTQIKLADGSNTTFDSENPDIRYKQGGKIGQDITCVNCGWSWNTDDSDESDKYVCHKCGFDNRTFYDSEPIGYADGGYIDKIFYHGTGEKQKVIDAIKNNTFRFSKSGGHTDGMYITPIEDLAIKYSELTDGQDKGVVKIRFKKNLKIKKYKNNREQYEDEKSFQANSIKESLTLYYNNLLDEGYDAIQSSEDVILVLPQGMDSIEVYEDSKTNEEYADGGILDLYTASEIKKAYVSIKIPFDIERDKNFIYQVSKINDKPFEELQNHILNGVRGVSTSKYNIADWLSARQCLVLMKFSEFQKDNNTEQIKYNDISYLLSNGLDILFRIYDRKSKGDREYYDVLGNLFPKIALEFEIESQLYSDDRYTQYYFLEHIFNVYKSSKFREYFSKKPRVSSLRDITSILEEYLESGTAESDYPYERKPKYFDTDKISEVIKRGILYAIGIYTDESEWILKDAKLNIPKGSQLIFVLGTYDNHKDAYEQMIEKYHLRDSYKISFVKEKSISEFQSKKFAMQQRLHIENLENKKKDVDIKLYEIFNDKLYEIIEEIKQRLIYEIKESRTPPYMDYEDTSIEYGDNPLDIPIFKEMWTNAMSKLMELYDSEIDSVVSMKDKWSFVSIFSKFYDYIREKREESYSNDYEVAYSNDGRIWISLFYDRLVYAINYFDYKDFIKDIKEKVGADIYKAYDKKDIRFKQGGNIEKYNNGSLIDAIAASIENLKKNGIVIKDNDKTITLIAYNTGNQERNPSLYNKSLIYSSVQPLRSANEIIANLDSMDYEHFDIDRLEEYRNDHLIILNQNEVVYNSGKSDIKYEKGAIIENQFDDLGNNQLVQVLKSFYSDLSESAIFESLDLKEGDYTFNIGDNEFVLFRGKPFSNLERIKMGRFLQPYFDASKKPLFARFFDSYKVSGNNLIIKVRDMYEEGGEMTSDATIALPDTYSSIEKLKEILNTRGYDIVPIDKSIGKLAKGMTIEDIAERHGVSVNDLNIELENGIKSEMEHTNDKMVARAIALDHLYENPKYYSKLQSLNLGNGGVMEKGGMVVGKSHQEADENGTGEKFIVSSTGQIVELEGGEAVIVGEALNSDDELEFEGQKKSPREIASYLNHAYGGVKFERGGHVDCGCNKKYYHGGELPSAVVDKLSGGEAVITKKTMESKDKYTFEGEKLTPRQILSRINHKYGGVSFAKGGEIGAKRFSPEIKLAKMVYFVNNIKNG